MKIDLSIDRVRVPRHIDEPIRVAVHVVNDGSEPLSVCTELAESRYLVNGREEDTQTKAWANPPMVEVVPGAATVVEDTFDLHFDSVYRGVAALERVAFQALVTLLVGGRRETLQSPVTDLEVDFRAVAPLPAPDGTRSRYLVDGERVIYASTFSRAYERRTRVLPVDRATMAVLSDSYLVDGKSVYRNGRVQKGVRPDGFRVLNPIFAGNASVILTTYGDAKVAAPASFEALDDARNLVCPATSAGGSGYRGGYGRDSVAVYFFDEGTSTHHAVRLRGCKEPLRFVALAHGHGKDDRNVYREATAIKGADPATWTLLSRSYSRDARAVFYGTTRIADADPTTFQVLDTPGRPGTAFESCWARDARGYFERTLRRSEAEYQSGC